MVESGTRAVIDEDASPARVVAFVGPTAAGKAELGLEAARRFDRPVLVCDSVKVYRRLDIGSAKPSEHIRTSVPHRLIDLVEPDQVFSAGDYARAAWEVLQQEGGIFVGGTGFYLRAVGWTQSAPATADGRHDDPARVEFDRGWETCERADPGSAHRALVARDPDTAEGIHPHNLVRILRALWLCELHGGPVSRVREQDPPRPRIPMMLVVCDPGTAEVDDRIERRLGAMFEAGWLQEVERLVADGYDERHKAMRTLGYRQLVDVVKGRQDLGVARQAVLLATRHYARRQRTYFRHQLPAEEIVHIGDPRGCPWERIDAFLGPSPRREGRGHLR